MVTSKQSSAPAVNETVCLPSVSNVGSSAPLGKRRATAKSSIPLGPPAPAKMIRPTESTAAAYAPSLGDSKSIVLLPSPSKLASRAPPVVRRATAKSFPVPVKATPARTTRSSESMATDVPYSAVKPKSIVCLPSPLKLLSSAPPAVSRATAKSYFETLYVYPAAIMRFCESTATSKARSASPLK